MVLFLLLNGNTIVVCVRASHLQSQAFFQYVNAVIELTEFSLVSIAFSSSFDIARNSQLLRLLAKKCEKQSLTKTPKQKMNRLFNRTIRASPYQTINCVNAVQINTVYPDSMRICLKPAAICYCCCTFGMGESERKRKKKRFVSARKRSNFTSLVACAKCVECIERIHFSS